MLSQPDGPFINVQKLNLAKYGQRQNLAKVKYIARPKLTKPKEVMRIKRCL